MNKKDRGQGLFASALFKKLASGGKTIIMTVSKNKTRVTINIDSTLYHEIKQYAESENRTATNFIIVAVKKYLNFLKEKEGDLN